MKGRNSGPSSLMRLDISRLRLASSGGVDTVPAATVVIKVSLHSHVFDISTS